MTFRKKDPEFVTLYFITEIGSEKASKTRQYRVSKRTEFIEILQVIFLVNIYLHHEFISFNFFT